MITSNVTSSWISKPGLRPAVKFRSPSGVCEAFLRSEAMKRAMLSSGTRIHR